MVFVIAEPCIGCCDGACVQVCPVDCIHGPTPLDELERLPPEERKARVTGLQLFIDPTACIGCGACAPECPVDAIYDEDELPRQWAHYAAKNEDFFALRRKP